MTAEESNAPMSAAVLSPGVGTGAAAPVPAPRRRPWNLMLALGAVGIVLIVTAGVIANALVSDQYSPRRAVLDYLTAQSRGDVDGMWQNAVFRGGEGAYHDFFTKQALQGMMTLSANRDISSLRVENVKQVNSNAMLATVVANWYGSPGTLELRVEKDPSRTHWLVYPSWRVVAPTSSINFTYPSQGGEISIDGVVLPDSAGSTIQLISGKHYVAMSPTDILAEWSQTVDASSPSQSIDVQITDTLTPAAAQAAADAVKRALTTCDASKHNDCIGHRYTAPNDGNQYFLIAPDGTHLFYTHYQIDLVGDPTAKMTTDFDATDGEITVNGTCTVRLTTDSRGVDRSGTFTGKLTWNDGRFDSDLTGNC